MENKTPQLQITDTLTKSKRLFVPLKQAEITLYQCGPTVYWNQHIGNMRAMVMSDLVRRSLAYLYPDSLVKFVRNYTDVGHLSGDNAGDADTGVDRMERGALREGLSPDEIANKYIAQFESDIASLNCLPVAAGFRPRATDYVNQMRDMVQLLLDNDFAYTTPLAIYFDISKKSDYTKLSNQDISKLIGNSGHGDVTDGDKKNIGDFSLWFFRTGTHVSALQYWDSPDFKEKTTEQKHGFPGWHIECSAMIRALLGPSIDIHMGGIEHIPIHHTNELAQSETTNHICDSDKPFVNYWLHNEHLNVDDKKMSKSEGTSYVLQDIIDRRYTAMDLRYFFLQAHYRSKQNFTWDALSASKTARERLIARLCYLHNTMQEFNSGVTVLDLDIHSAISDDFNIPNLLGILHKTLSTTTELTPSLYKAILNIDSILGLDLLTELTKLNSAKLGQDVPARVTELAELRVVAKSQKNWVESDRLRDELAQMGYNITDTDAGYTLQQN